MEKMKKLTHVRIGWTYEVWFRIYYAFEDVRINVVMDELLKSK